MNSNSPGKRPIWQFFLPPMLLLSFGLHGLILFAPIAPDDDELVPPPDPEEDSISLTKVEPPVSQRTSLPAGNAATPNPSATAQRVNQPPIAPAAGSSQVRAAAGTEASAGGTSRNTVADRVRAGNPGPQSRRGRPGHNPRPREWVSRADGQTNSSANSSANNLAAVAAIVSSPNPSPPERNQGTAAADRRQFIAYADIFATYQGPQPSTAAEFDERKSLWMSSFTAQGAPYTDLEIQPLAEVGPVPYEAKLCLPAYPTPAELLVLVEADGTVNRDIMTLQSTGYRKFNQAALVLAQQHPYPSVGHPQAYSVQVEVAYDAENCQWPPTATNLPDDYFTLLKSYVGPASTTLAEAQEKQTEWQQTLAKDETIASPEAILLEDFQARVAYPDNICLPVEPTEVRLGVVVDSEGSLQGELQSLRSSGYAIFDQRARDLVEAFEFPKIEHPQAYVVVVQTAYNAVNCQPLTSRTFELGTSEDASENAVASSQGAITDPETTSTPLAFAPDRQQALIDIGRQNLVAQSYGSLNGDPGLAAAVLATGWPETLNQRCFLTQLDETFGPMPVAEAIDALIIALNVERAPETVADQYDVELNNVGDHCGADLYELREDGVPQLFASLVGFGAGNSNTLVVLWPNNPRQ